MKNNLTKIFAVIVVLNILNLQCLYCATYIYKLNQEAKLQSSVATIAEPSFNFESEAQVLMEPETGTIIYAHNENEKMLPASVTKIMTLLLIMEQIDSGLMTYEDKITCSKNASQMGGSQIWFREGEQLTVDESLKAICVVSANDVTVAMAEHIGGSEENFVSMMNSKAKELGMENTNFINSHGIDAEGHYTSAKDIALMSRELMVKHPDILKYTSIWMDTLRDGEFGLSNTNRLIRFYDGGTGLKTGYTSQALYNLAGTATRNGTSFISVIMRAPSSDIRLAETKTLLDYGFSNYEVKKVCSSNVILDEMFINKNVSEKIQTRIKEDIYVLNRRGDKVETIQNITYNDLIAGIKANDEIGNIEIYNSQTNEKLGESIIISNNNIEKSKFGDYMKFIFDKLILRS